MPEKMSEISLSHTLSSHGGKLAKSHKYDWIILLLLTLIDAGLNYIEPFHRFIGEGMMEDLKFPFKRQDTIPFWAVPVIAVVFPIVVFTAFYYKRRDVYDLHHAVLGIFYAVLITGVITDSIKDAVGRPRPNFFYRCFPDGIAAFDIAKQGDVLCDGDSEEIKEGYKSFPSGHSSWSFAGLGFLAWYIAGKIKVFDQRGHVAKLCLALLPLLVASLIAVSRVDDYWHHWQDVFAGGFLGLIVASFTYLQFFPLPSGEQGWGPHAYFKALANSHRESSFDEMKELHSSEEDIEELENGRRV